MIYTSEAVQVGCKTLSIEEGISTLSGLLVDYNKRDIELNKVLEQSGVSETVKNAARKELKGNAENVELILADAKKGGVTNEVMTAALDII